ncbi:alpha/beta fold hydrolase [Devosia ginsengisoli]|uniref:alpha/beta fold hydrolase n=1 Tax=Devosia ginsengisoli TaxID=400770 RepID=UPI0026EDB053|nr:alpha/beta hydrolase [Devosia ginsengisoli]MCR6671229.1 alpha/beta hydrolase [Devosia ginsengisoli]
MSTFVIVHGAWAGSWGWDPVAERLRASGHRVHVPTLSGLGERSHLAHLPIDLITHIDDIVNEMVWHALDDVVLVAHSYGGFVATGVVERAADRIASIVYLDAFIPEDGQSFADIIGEKLTGPVVPAPEIGGNEYPTEAERDRIAALATAQPTGTFTERLRHSGAYRQVARKTYILATGWEGFQQVASPLRDDPAWTVHELPCGHDVPLLMPDELAALLEQA